MSRKDVAAKNTAFRLMPACYLQTLKGHARNQKLSRIGDNSKDQHFLNSAIPPALPVLHLPRPWWPAFGGMERTVHQAQPVTVLLQDQLNHRPARRQTIMQSLNLEQIETPILAEDTCAYFDMNSRTLPLPLSKVCAAR